jgi:hypothetical protein
MPWFEINLGQKADRKVAQNTFAASNWPRGGSCTRAKSSGGRRHAVSLRFCFSAVLFDLIDLPSDDPAEIILIGGLAANDFGAPTVVPAAEIKPQLRSAILVVTPVLWPVVPGLVLRQQRRPL